MTDTPKNMSGNYRQAFVDDLKVTYSHFSANLDRSKKLVEWASGGGGKFGRECSPSSIETEVLRWSLVNAVSAMDSFFRQFISAIDAMIALGASEQLGNLYSAAAKSLSFDSKIFRIIHSQGPDEGLKFRAAKMICHRQIEKEVFQNHGRVLTNLSDRGIVSIKTILPNDIARKDLLKILDDSISRRNRIVHRGDEAFDLALTLAPLPEGLIIRYIDSISKFAFVYYERSSSLVYAY